MGRRKDLAFWHIPVTKALDDAVEKAVKADTHVSKSDLIRDAVRQFLKTLDVPVRETLPDERL
jgi:Arc/MetJ-type ribon-helix-helix transcriptional regulator